MFSLLERESGFSASVVVLGGGIKPEAINLTEERQNIKLGKRSKMRVLALDQLLREKKISPWQIIFSGGHTLKGAISESLGMFDYAFGHSSPSVVALERGANPFNGSRAYYQRRGVVFEERSVDTVGNAQEVANLLDAQNLEEEGIALVSSLTHLLRAKRLFSAYGIKVDKMYPAEFVLWRRSAHHRRYLLKYFASKDFWQGLAVEAAGNLLMLGDPKGERLKRFSQKRGK